jgi:hypothetical protein
MSYGLVVSLTLIGTFFIVMPGLTVSLRLFAMLQASGERVARSR